MLKTLFEDQRKYLNHFFDTVDLIEVNKVFEVLLACKGVVVFTGVGKSGHIAEKISATFSSTGTRSFFLSPANALHGDIGSISSQDVLIALSKSGSSREIFDLFPHVQKRGAKVVAVVSTARSQLAEVADLSIVLPVEREICPYDLAPTTSATVQLIFGDCLAIALMQAKRFSVADFAANHPGGLLGRKITLKVSDLMLKGDALPLCSPEDALIDVLHELSVKRCGCLLVADEKRLLRGVFTDGDLRRSIETYGPNALQKKLKELMTVSFKNISPDQLATAAIEKMEENTTRPITILPVLEGGEVVGLIRMHDILQKGLS